MIVIRVFAIMLLLCSSALAQLRVGAAISLKSALEQVTPEFEKQSGEKVELVFASSGQILGQIRNGAPIDLFIAAANAQVDEIVAGGLGVNESRRVIAGNTLVLVVPSIGKDPPRSFADLATPRFRRISIGEPRTVPAGQYAMQALTRMGLADAIEDRLVYGANVRQVLTYVEQGEVVAGIVYGSDAKESAGKARVVGTADPSTHDPIVYPAIILKSSKQAPLAGKFIDYLTSEAARKIFTEKGFSTAAITLPTTTPAR